MYNKTETELQKKFEQLFTVKILTHVSFYLILSMYLDSWDGFYPKENITNLLQLSFRMFVCLDFLHMPLFSLILFLFCK